MDSSSKVAQVLLETESVKFKPNDMFTLVSGMKSPIYVDNRNLLAYPKQRSEVADMLATQLSAHYGPIDAVAGTATAGIAWAQAIAERLDLPMAYVRSEKKEHGTSSAVEGFKKPDSKVVIVEDLLTTGGSAITSATRLRELNIEPVGITAIVSYGFSSAAAGLAENGLKWHALVDVPSVLEQSELSDADKDLVRAWLAERNSG